MVDLERRKCQSLDLAVHAVIDLRISPAIAFPKFRKSGESESQQLFYPSFDSGRAYNVKFLLSVGYPIVEKQERQAEEVVTVEVADEDDPRRPGCCGLLQVLKRRGAGIKQIPVVDKERAVRLPSKETALPELRNKRSSFPVSRASSIVPLSAPLN
jgi:hypothetical protein